MIIGLFDTVVVVQPNKIRIAHVSTRIAAAVVANYILQTSSARLRPA